MQLPAASNNATNVLFYSFFCFSPVHLQDTGMNLTVKSAVELSPPYLNTLQSSAKSHITKQMLLCSRKVILSRIKWSDWGQRKKAREVNATVLLALNVFKYLQLSHLMTHLQP